MNNSRDMAMEIESKFSYPKPPPIRARKSQSLDNCPQEEEKKIESDSNYSIESSSNM